MLRIVWNIILIALKRIKM